MYSNYFYSNYFVVNCSFNSYSLLQLSKSVYKTFYQSVLYNSFEFHHCSSIVLVSTYYARLQELSFAMFN